MERAARLFKNKLVSREVITQEDVARAAWPVAVGKIVAAHTGRLRVVRTHLIVEVEDAIWQRQLFSLSHQILRRLADVMGPHGFTEVEFRIGIPRRQPQRAEEPRPTPLFPPQDEADSIADPVLQKVYRLSRKKATA